MIGEVKTVLRTTPPKGWAFCNGQKISILGNEKLFKIIGFAFGGEGDFFRLPDYRGKVLISSSDSKELFSYGGSEEIEISNGNLPNHYHGVKVPLLDDEGDSEAGAGNIFSATTNSNGEGLSSFSTEEGDSEMREFNTESFGGGQPISVMQPYGVVNYIIKVN